MGVLGDVGKILNPNNALSNFGIGGNASQGPKNNIPKISDIPTNQTVLDLQKQLKDTPAPERITGYQAKTISGPLPEYDVARQKINESANSEGQAGSEALARRFASIGGGANSGAFIKQSELQNQSNETNRSNNLRDIAAQEAQTTRGLQQAEDTKAYQSGENAKNFNSQQAFQDKVFRFDSSSKLGQLDLAYKSAEENAATDAYNAELNSYTAKHTGGILGSGGLLGTGLFNN